MLRGEELTTGLTGIGGVVGDEKFVSITEQVNPMDPLTPGSQVHHQVVRKDFEARDIELDPVVHLYFVEVDEPDMHDQAGDLQRLERALEREWGITGLRCDLRVLQDLQPALREGRWAVTVAIRHDGQIVAVWPGFRDRAYGAAVDVGSTTIALHLCDLASGEVLAWLNADDLYYPGALQRVQQVLQDIPKAALCFGRCPIIDAQGRKIRTGITRFKEFFYPLSSRFTYQCINYLSQPALFFRRSAFAQAGPLREDMIAAWDYEFILRLWRSGWAVQVPGAPLAAFRWHEQSISGQQFAVQFQEEYQAAQADAGRFSPQALMHFFVRWGIVGMYSLMARRRRRSCA